MKCFTKFYDEAKKTLEESSPGKKISLNTILSETKLILKKVTDLKFEV